MAAAFAMDDGPSYLEQRAKDGQLLRFDISRKATEKFGFFFGDRVKTPIGPATVLGFRDKFLWFLVDSHGGGASFWDNATDYESLLKLGITLQPNTPEKHGYKVKKTSFGGKNVAVILQNENGPCPLIGIGNVLALRGDISVEDEGNVVPLETLMERLSGYLLTKHMEKGEEAQLMVEKATQIMPTLQVGLDVNFNFKDYDKFEKTEQCKLFDLFNIRLVHGWLVDPADTETYNAIAHHTYNDLMNKLVALDSSVSSSPTSSSNAQSPNPSSNSSDSQSTPLSPSQRPKPQSDNSSKKPEEAPPKPPTEEDFREGAIITRFLNASQSQLTAYGLSVLQRSIEEGELCVFFRNNHFSTLTKHDGQLYILVTDIGYERERNIVWDLMSSVDGNSVFCTSEFTSSEQVNREEIVNTLTMYDIPISEIEDILCKLTKEELSNADTAISRALSLYNQKPQVV